MHGSKRFNRIRLIRKQLLMASALRKLEFGYFLVLWLAYLGRYLAGFSCKRLGNTTGLLSVLTQL